MAIERYHENAPLAATGRDPEEAFKLLSIYDEDATAPERARITAIATISAGYRAEGKDGRAGLPQRSRDGEIYLHDPEGMAPGLKAALEATGGKRLTIAFTSSDPAEVIQQRYTRYSTKRLEAYGDHRAIIVIREDGTRDTCLAGTDEYKRERASCKVSTSVYFILAEWGPDGPRMLLPDGFGHYRLRFTSSNSARRFQEQFQWLARVTRGQIVGVPLDLWIGFPEVAGPDGTRRKVPVWNIRLMPRGGVVLDSRTLPLILAQSVEEGQRLSLPAPGEETVEAALLEPPDVDMDELARGPRCDAAHYNKLWHATVAGTPWATDDVRHDWISGYTDGEHKSLRTFLAEADTDAADAMIAELAHNVETWRRVTDTPAQPPDEKPEEERCTPPPAIDPVAFAAQAEDLDTAIGEPWRPEKQAAQSAEDEEADPFAGDVPEPEPDEPSANSDEFRAQVDALLHRIGIRLPSKAVTDRLKKTFGAESFGALTEAQHEPCIRWLTKWAEQQEARADKKDEATR